MCIFGYLILKVKGPLVYIGEFLLPIFFRL